MSLIKEYALCEVKKWEEERNGHLIPPPYQVLGSNIGTRGKKNVRILQGHQADIVNILYEGKTNDNNMMLFVQKKDMMVSLPLIFAPSPSLAHPISPSLFPSSLSHFPYYFLKVKLSSQNKISQSLFFFSVSIK